MDIHQLNQQSGFRGVDDAGIVPTNMPGRGMACHAPAVMILLWLVACTPQPAPPLTSTWGAVVTVGTAEQTRAPAMAAVKDRVTLAWIGASEAGVHQDIAAVQGGSQSAVITLPLPPTFPRDSRLFPAAGERNVHLLWLDVDSAGNPQLYSAVVDETLTLFRGALPVSVAGGRCFDGFSQPDRALWAVWYGGSDAAPALYSAYIDPTGLILRRQYMRLGGGCPVAVATFSGRYLLWMRGDDLYAAPFRNGAISEPRIVGEMPALFDGDRLRSLRGGSDGTRLYAFWNITRANGDHETWLASGTPDTITWDKPRRLVIAPDANTPFETTFNTGKTAAASGAVGGINAAWASPLRTVNDPLAVAVQVDNVALGVVYLRGGDAVGWQRVVSTNPLLGAPELQTDVNRHLYLAWSEPLDTGVARMQVTSTRHLNER